MAELTYDEINAVVNLEVLSEQAMAAIKSKDPDSFISENINWEIDQDLESDQESYDSFHAFLQPTAGVGFNRSYAEEIRLGRFREWWRRSRMVKKARKGFCKIVDIIQDAIDLEEKLSSIIAKAIAAIVAAIGIALNAVTATIIAGLVVKLILYGLDAVCPA